MEFFNIQSQQFDQTGKISIGNIVCLITAMYVSGISESVGAFWAWTLCNYFIIGMMIMMLMAVKMIMILVEMTFIRMLMMVMMMRTMMMMQFVKNVLGWKVAAASR